MSQTDMTQRIMNSKTSNNATLRNQTEGSWISSPRSSYPSHLLHDTTDDGKSVSAWPVSQPQSSILNIDRMLDQVDKDNKVETATTYRLFGIDLIDHSKKSAAVEKLSSHAVNGNGVTTEVSSSTLTSTDTARKSDISKASFERKQEPQQVSPKETQSKQICSRSRTKVLHIEHLFGQQFRCFPLL